MQSRDELLEKLNSTIEKLKIFSCPEYNGIYSSQYYTDILSKMYDNNESTYSYIFGDFNKLSIINKVHGNAFGDKSLKNALSVIKSTLPKNAIISRLGGDEFSIILPNTNSDICNEYIKKINQNLKINSISVGGLSIELSGADSSSCNNMEELYSKTESDVSSKKNARKKHDTPTTILFEDFLPLDLPSRNISQKEIENWKTLNNLTSVSVYNFLQNMRPSDSFVFTESQIKSSAPFITNVLGYLINENDRIENSKKSNVDYTNLTEEQSIPEHENSTYFNNINPRVASLVHKLITDSNINFAQLSESSIKKTNIMMENLLNDIIREQNSSLLSKPYFRLYLADKLSKSGKNYQGVYFSTSGIKLSNTAFDHKFTDYRLNKTSDIFIDTFAKYKRFNDIPFDCSDTDTFLIGQGAGNYLALIPEAEKMSNSKLDLITTELNSYCNINDSTSPFLIAAASVDNIEKSSPQSFIKAVRSLKEKANSNKDPLKTTLFEGCDAEICFKKSINNCVDFYLNNIHNAKADMTKKSIFIKNIFTSFINYQVSHNKQIYYKDDDYDLEK